MKNETTKALADAAIRLAVQGAKQYLDTHNLTYNPDTLLACVRSWVKIKLPEALADAKVALACHMDKVAEATFAASMFGAGIEAAKEAGQPAVNPNPEIIGYTISADAILKAAAAQA